MREKEGDMKVREKVIDSNMKEKGVLKVKQKKVVKTSANQYMNFFI
jgi:hypothetical protein